MILLEIKNRIVEETLLYRFNRCVVSQSDARTSNVCS